ncbi:PREDICTED: uncharacterized protein LOC108662382 [Theobroma cacao]|uniref:Uncharacterized protein LOC108662382 n=1 Tax=Theobroma cacao TaxID=3641 RepID=A0AB32WH30_THECC|nr:PREDICTED: uncharacterized protein LOC108662382 [Theobroma cacao]
MVHESLVLNPTGEPMIIFAKSIGIADSNLAEVRAVKEAMMIFAVSSSNDDHKLAIESDSGNVVKWIQSPVEAPWRMRKRLIQIERMKEKLGDWEIHHIKREANQRTDSLAKEGVQLQSDMLRVFN